MAVHAFAFAKHNLPFLRRPGYLAFDMCRRSPLARALAGLLILCFSIFSSVESVIPDSHEGKATAIEVGDASASSTIAATPGLDRTGAPNGTGDSTRSHSLHVDHCGHGHVASTARPGPESGLIRRSASVPGRAGLIPISAAIAPPVPPPLA